MVTGLNRKCHAVAAAVYGKGAHDALSRLATERGFASWAEVPDMMAREILVELKAAQRAGVALIAEATPGLSTRRQRDKIAALRHHMGWSWGYIRQLVRDYGVDDWTLLSLQDADNLIRRMSEIATNMKKRAQAKKQHTA